MKGFEKFLLVLFSILTLICSIAIILVSTQMIDLGPILSKLERILISNKAISVVCGAIFVLISLLGLFSSSGTKEEVKSGLAIQGEKGTVYITKDTFESIIEGITKSYPELRNVKVSVDMNEDGIVANVFTLILPDTVVPALTTKLQENIKSNILKQTTVEIKEANIKIKGVYEEIQKK